MFCCSAIEPMFPLSLWKQWKLPECFSLPDAFRNMSMYEQEQNPLKVHWKCWKINYAFQERFLICEQSINIWVGNNWHGWELGIIFLVLSSTDWIFGRVFVVFVIRIVVWIMDVVLGMYLSVFGDLGWNWGKRCLSPFIAGVAYNLLVCCLAPSQICTGNVRKTLKQTTPPESNFLRHSTVSSNPRTLTALPHPHKANLEKVPYPKCFKKVTKYKFPANLLLSQIPPSYPHYSINNGLTPLYFGLYSSNNISCRKNIWKYNLLELYGTHVETAHVIFVMR